MSDSTSFDFIKGELLLIDKPFRWTSFDAVAKIRNSLKKFGKKIKVGHAGTLDPLATGLLIICTGKMTKMIDSYQAQEKEYTGTMIMGASTPSYDMETEVDKHFDISSITEEQIRINCRQFIGEIEQFPPAHSAIKIDGERIYHKARRGEEVELKARKITITEFEITRIALPEIDFRVVCAKGTYIRSLAHDFGKALNNGAYLTNLRRTRIGEFKVENAWELQNFIETVKNINFTPGNE